MITQFIEKIMDRLLVAPLTFILFKCTFLCAKNSQKLKHSLISKGYFELYENVLKLLMS